jgi:hypothetical protein
MNIGEQIYARLTTYTAVSNLLAMRVYANVLPDNPTYPAACYQQISEAEPHEGDLPTFDVRYQIDCYGRKYEYAAPLADAVQLALHDWGNLAGTPAIINVRRAGRFDAWDQATKSHRVSCDFVIQFCE